MREREIIEALTEDEVDEIPLSDKKERKLLIGVTLEDQERDELIAFLRSNKDYFAWSHKDMSKSSSTIIIHQLIVKEGAKLDK